jgi:hypothetical protein
MTGEILLAIRILLAILLYSFLGWAFVTLWRDLREQTRAVSASRVPPIRIIWQAAEHKNIRQYPGPNVVIGRDPTCDCAITDDTVSARHAQLSYHHSQWWLEDLSSTNGTFINQEPLETPTVIVNGDEIRCGGIGLTVNIDG